MISPPSMLVFFFFNDTATTEIYTLSLHDALPIWGYLFFSTLAVHLSVISYLILNLCHLHYDTNYYSQQIEDSKGDRKSTRLNSSHSQISYAVFCLKKKKTLKLSRRAPR